MASSSGTATNPATHRLREGAQGHTVENSEVHFKRIRVTLDESTTLVVMFDLQFLRVLRKPTGLGMIALAALSIDAFAQANVDDLRPIGTITLTEGAYPETFENDTLRWVGNALFNTRLGEVVQVRDGDRVYRFGFQRQEKADAVHNAISKSVDFGARVSEAKVGRWLSLDPKFKSNESPYAAFSNSPLYYADPDGKDTLVFHRSARSESIKSGNADIYLVTFSVIQNGVERAVDGVMYMYGDQEANKRGDNGLRAKDVYKLTWAQLSNHDGDAGWENTIRVTDFGVFMHPGVGTEDFEGCYGLSEQQPNEEVIGDTKYHSIDWQGSQDALQKVRDLYNEANGGEGGGKLTGDKFILKSRSEAPIGRMEIRQPVLPTSSGPKEPVK